VRPGEQAHAEDVHVLLDGRVDHLLGRAVEPRVDDVHPGVAQAPRHHLDPAVVAVEPDLGEQDPDVVAHVRLAHPDALPPPTTRRTIAAASPSWVQGGAGHGAGELAPNHRRSPRDVPQHLRALDELSKVPREPCRRSAVHDVVIDAGGEREILARLDAAVDEAGLPRDAADSVASGQSLDLVRASSATGKLLKGA
jgi:hypothetical protein